MQLCVCADSMGLWGFIFSHLNTFQIKTICWKQPSKMEILYIHDKSIRLLFLFFRPMWLHGLLTPRYSTSLCFHHQRYYSCQILWIHYPLHKGAKATGRWEILGDSVSSTQTRSKKAGFMSVSEVPRSLPVQKWRRHWGETRMSPGKKTVPLKSPQ